MLLSGKFILIVWFVYPWFLAAEQWNLYPRQGTGPVSKIQYTGRRAGGGVAGVGAGPERIEPFVDAYAFSCCRMESNLATARKLVLYKSFNPLWVGPLLHSFLHCLIKKDFYCSVFCNIFYFYYYTNIEQ